MIYEQLPQKSKQKVSEQAKLWLESVKISPITGTARLEFLLAEMTLKQYAATEKSKLDQAELIEAYEKKIEMLSKQISNLSKK